MEITPEALYPSGSRQAADEDEMQIVYVMEVIDPFERPRGARYVRRFTYETREQAWARYGEAIRFGFEAYVEEVGRMRGTTQTTAHEDLGRSSVRPGAHLATAPSPNDAATASAGNHGGGDAFGLAGSASP